jgi:hypothetical protein
VLQGLAYDHNHARMYSSEIMSSLENERIRSDYRETRLLLFWSVLLVIFVTEKERKSGSQLLGETAYAADKQDAHVWLFQVLAI